MDKLFKHLCCPSFGEETGLLKTLYYRTRENMTQVKYSNIRAARKNRLPVLAIDADGTLLEYTHPPDIGAPLPGMREELEKLRKHGWLIVIWTVRSDVEQMRNHLEAHDIPFDFINQNPYGPPDGSNKIYSDVYLDDKALRFDGETDGLADKILYFRPWHGGE